jgi:hypothetical protein
MKIKNDKKSYGKQNYLCKKGKQQFTGDHALQDENRPSERIAVANEKLNSYLLRGSKRETKFIFATR